MRAIPGLITLRPADADEVVEAWKVIMQLRHEPVALILTRQAVPTLDRTKYASAEGLRRGAYVLADAPDGKPDVLLLATGSEVALCVEAHERLKADGIKARVVSMPSWEMFEYHCSKNPEYRDSVLPSTVTARVSVEQASTFGWERYVGDRWSDSGHEDVRRIRAAQRAAEEDSASRWSGSWRPRGSSCALARRRATAMTIIERPLDLVPDDLLIGHGSPGATRD